MNAGLTAVSRLPIPCFAGGSGRLDVARHVHQFLVLDTHIVLDLWVFQNPDAAPLRQALEQGALVWLATAGMREELRRVLDYPQIAQRRQARGLTVDAVLAQMDRHVVWQAQAPRCIYVCKDPDDQPFIDLAAAHRALLLSRDGQVLRLRRRLQRLGADVCAVWPTNS
jgi:predicted nucleic acid-binding protein